MDDQEKKQLFRKFLDNRCSAEEIEKILDLLKAEEVPPELEALIDEDAQKQLLENRSPSPDIHRKLLSNLRERILLQNAHSSFPHRTTQIPLYLRYAAAVFAGILLLAVGYYFYLFQQNETVYLTDFGKTENILLPDSSVVVLNANSKLTYTEDSYTATVREVWLEGEAYFKVLKKGKPVPFIVHTNNLQVEVLGTQFNVNSRKDKTQVVLNTGKVKLTSHAGNDELIMKPGELVEVSGTNQKFKKATVDTEVYTSWRNNKLIFDATPITEITRILEDNYGFEVQVIEDKINEKMVFTGTIPTDDIELLLTLLSESFAIKVTKQGNKIIIGK